MGSSPISSFSGDAFLEVTASDTVFVLSNARGHHLAARSLFFKFVGVLSNG